MSTLFPPQATGGNPYTVTDNLSNLIQTAYDRKVRLAFRSEPLFRMFADTKVVNQTQPGSTVVFSIHKELPIAIAPLDELNDGDGASIDNPTQVEVQVKRYGSYTIYTEELMAFAFDDALAANVTNQIRNNQADSLDTIVGRILLAGVNNHVLLTSSYVTETAAELYTGGKPTFTGSTNVVTNYVGTVPTATVKAAGDVFVEAVQNIVAELRSASVPAKDGVYYTALMHPKVAAQFRAVTDAAAWRDTLKHTDPSLILKGEIGVFEGVRVIESPRIPVEVVDGVTIYNTVIMGAEALAEVVVKEPTVIVDGTIPDPYNRKTAIGWTGLIGWNLFRPESLHVIKSAGASTVATGTLPAFTVGETEQSAYAAAVEAAGFTNVSFAGTEAGENTPGTVAEVFNTDTDEQYEGGETLPLDTPLVIVEYSVISES